MRQGLPASLTESPEKHRGVRFASVRTGFHLLESFLSVRVGSLAWGVVSKRVVLYERKTCFTAKRAFAIPNTVVSRNRRRIWLLLEVVFRALATPSAFFDLRTSTCRRGVHAGEHFRRRSVERTAQIMRKTGPADRLSSLETRMQIDRKRNSEVAHYRVNVEGGN